MSLFNKLFGMKKEVETLFGAVTNGNIKIVQSFAKNNPDLLGKKYKKHNPAMMAAFCGQADCLQIIAEIAPNSLADTNKEGNTPAKLAAASGHANCLEIIAKIAPDTLNPDERGVGPATIAAKYGHVNCLKVIANLDAHLLDSVAMAAAFAFNKKDCLQFLSEQSRSIKVRESAMRNLEEMNKKEEGKVINNVQQDKGDWVIDESSAVAIKAEADGVIERGKASIILLHKTGRSQPISFEAVVTCHDCQQEIPFSYDDIILAMGSFPNITCPECKSTISLAYVCETKNQETNLFIYASGYTHSKNSTTSLPYPKLKITSAKDVSP